MAKPLVSFIAILFTFQAAMIEIDKEKAQKKIERLTTGMFPKANSAPTQETYYKVRFVLIVRLISLI